MLNPGKTIPTMGTNIEGRYDAVILCDCKYIYILCCSVFILIKVNIDVLKM